MQVNTNPITAEIYYTENEKKEKSLYAVWVPELRWKYIDSEGKMAADQQSPAGLLRIPGMKVSKLIVNEDIRSAMEKLIAIWEEYDKKEDELEFKNENLLRKFVYPPKEPIYARVNFSLESSKYFLLHFPREEIYYHSGFCSVRPHTSNIIEKFKNIQPTAVSQSTFEIIEQLVHEGIEKEVVAYHLRETRRVFLDMIQSEKKKLA